MLETGRGSLPFALVHGEPLVACAVWALGEAGVFVVDLGTSWAAVTDAGVPFVLHDPLCPLTPPEFIVECVSHAAERSSVTVGVRPVTDTVKELHDGRVGATVDRDRLLQVVSPVVLPAAVVAALDGVPTSTSRRSSPSWPPASRSRRSTRLPRLAGWPTSQTSKYWRR